MNSTWATVCTIALGLSTAGTIYSLSGNFFAAGAGQVAVMCFVFLLASMLSELERIIKKSAGK